MALSIKQYIYIGIGLLIAFLAWKVYDGYKELEALRVEKQKTEQNAQAWKDSANAIYAREQALAIFVQDLNGTILTKDREIVALRTKNSVLIDSIRILNQPSGVVVVTDSTVMVPFEGERGIADYRGCTIGNSKTKKGTYSLDIWFPRPVETTSELFRDPEDNLWKMRSISLTEGVKIKGISTIDEGVWRQIEAGLQPPSKPDFLAVGGMWTQDANGTVRSHLGLGIKPSSYMVMLQYNLSSYEQSVDWQRRISVGFYWFLF